MRSRHRSWFQIVATTDLKPQDILSISFCPPIASTPEPAVAAPRGRRPWRRCLVALGSCGALIVTLLASFALAAPAGDSIWTAAAAMNTVRNSHTATLLPAGRVLVAGGWDGVMTLASAELYDPATQGWMPAGALHEARAFHTAALLPDGQVLVAGGWDIAGNALASAELYDPRTGTWAPTAEMKGGRAGHTATGLPDGKVLVVGGCDRDGALAGAELYDPIANGWGSAGAMKDARCWHTATRLPDGRVLVVGGRDSSGRPLASAELYDPAKNVWMPAATLATPRLDHTATLLPDGGVLIVGGYNGSYLASAELYDPAANAWTSAGKMSIARAYHAALLLRNGQVLVAGGSSGSRPHASAELYDPRTQAWTPAGAMTAPYESHLAILLSDGQVLITGRPDSGDPTGNNGYPTPSSGAQNRPRPPSTPQPPMQPTPTPKAASASGETASDAFAAFGDAFAAAAAGTSSGNFTTETDTATLFGVHEITLRPGASPGNPYDRSITVTFTPNGDASLAKTVYAFYNGSDAQGEIWNARVYVNRVGNWSWQASTDATDNFTATAPEDSQLRGMLRVSSESATSVKRWYTDDGRTFLPMADTAYRLFFERPITSTQPVPADCPPARDSSAFVTLYASDVVSRGINVLRVEALGTWAHEDRKGCDADLSLFWSNQRDGSTIDLFDGSPSIEQLSGSSVYYPNRQSFQRTDEKLKLLLEAQPSLYVQMILVPEPDANNQDHSWLGISATFRQQLWNTMIARWAAFPNVFWSISNDLGDSDPDPFWTWISYPNNRLLAEEVGDYFAGTGSPDTMPDPWHQGRPMSFGHLRNRKDAFITAPWHSYITAYSYADISAQQMDGNVWLPEDGRFQYNAPLFHYTLEDKPTYNTEDQYEQRYKDNVTKLVENPDYFFRRLFWSYLLSGSGATYGADSMWRGLAIYSNGTYTTSPGYPEGTTNPQYWITHTLTGLNGVQYIPGILDDARVDLGLFQPDDTLIQKSGTLGWEEGTAAWQEYNRAQVARRGSKEILAYIPNTVEPVYPEPDIRRRAAPAATNATVSVSMTNFTDPNYAVTWYSPTTGEVTGTVTLISGTTTVPLTAPSTLKGDAVLHISSRCLAPNVCEPMDGDPPVGITVTLGSSLRFSAGEDQNADFVTDTLSVFDGNSSAGSWRCNRLPPSGQETSYPGCWVRGDFDAGRTVASADFYFRRNSTSAYQGLYFITVPNQDPQTPIVDGDAATSIDVWFGTEGDLHLGLSPGQAGPVLETKPGVAPDPNRWYHLSARVERTGTNMYRADVFVDGVLQITKPELHFPSGDPFFRRVVVHTAWWGPTTDLDSSGTPSVWWDELTIDPPASTETQGLFLAFFQQGLGGYASNRAMWFDYSAGYNNTNLLYVGANNGVKSLLRFDLSKIPAGAIVDEATLQLYYTGRSNGNSLTLGAHRVLNEWTDSQANRVQRKTGVNWTVAGMGAGSDYAATAEATAAVTGVGGAWVELDLTSAAQAWVTDAANNQGLVLLQAAAGGYVTYDFCSELGWSPCAATQAPKLTLRYHLAPPPPVKATFQQGAGGYGGNNATYFDYSYGYNNSSLLQVGADNAIKSLLRFDVSAIPAGKIVDEATLRLYYRRRSNSNPLTLGAHGVLADWIDSQANRVQRKSGVNWSVAGMGSGSDYTAAAAGTTDIAGGGGAWIELDVTGMVQAWVADPASNHGLVLLQEAAGGYVIYDFCSELGWSPCTAAQAPKLTIWYRP